MLIKPLLAAAVLNAVAVAATPAELALLEYTDSLPKNVTKHPGVRPKISFEPKQPYRPFGNSSARNRNCYVSSHNDGVTDDSPYILDAINKCNPGGHVIFSEGTDYVIGTALDLTNLTHVDLGKSCAHP
jgi:galacturan 1,4-alpha-galacturonidase